MNFLGRMGVGLGMCLWVIMLWTAPSDAQLVIDLSLLTPPSCTPPLGFGFTVQPITNGCRVLIAGKYNIDDNTVTGDGSGNDIEIFNINGNAAVEFTEVIDSTPSSGSDSHKHQIVLKNARIRNAVTTRASLANPIYIVSHDLIELQRLGTILDSGDRKGNHIYGGAWRATDDLGRTSTSSAEGSLCAGTECAAFTPTSFLPSLVGNLSGIRRLTASFSGNNLNVQFANEPTATERKAFVLGKVSVIGLKPPVRNQDTGAITNDEYLDASVTVNLDNSGASIGGGGAAPCDVAGEPASSGELVCVELWEGFTLMEPSAAISALQTEHCPKEFENKCVKK